MIAVVDVEQLAEAARLEAEQHKPRTPGRRAAAHLWVAATVPPARSVAALMRAVESFGAPATQAAALELLHRLAVQLATSQTEQEAADG